MPATLQIPGQVLAEPVTNYYRGKAIRADIDLREKQAQALQMEIESAPAAAAAAARKEQREIAKAEREAQAAIDAGNDREAGILAEAGAAAVIADREDGDATSAFYSALDAYGFSEEQQASVRKSYDKDGDGVLGPSELRSLEAFSTAFGKLEAAKADQRRTLTSEEAMALPGMTQQRAENAVIQVDGNGQIFIDDAPTGMTDVDLAARGGLSPSGLNTTTVAFREQVKQAAAGAATATELVEISYDSPAAMAKAGSIVTFGSELYSVSKALVELVASPALSKSETKKQEQGYSAFDWGDVDKEMSKLGVAPEDAARWKSGVYSIAFSAAVGEQGSRPSDKDIQAYIEIYGGNITKPEAFRATVAQAMRRQYNMLKFAAELNPEIEDSAQSLAVFERVYSDFLSALDGGQGGTGGIKIISRRPIE